MLQINRILCFLSEAPTSSAALRHAAFLSQTADATLYALTSGSPTRSINTVADALDEIAGTGNEIPLRTLSPSVSSSPTPENIASYVAEIQPDLIVTDTPSDRGPIPPMASEIPRYCIENLNVPVFVTDRHTRVKSLDHILVPSGLSEYAHRALNHAIAVAELYDASIDVLHVIDTDPFVALTPVDRLSLRSTSLPEHRARHRLSKMLDRCRETNVQIDSHIAYGNPADQISHYVSDNPVHLVVLSAPATGPQVTPRHGEIADRVLRRVTCPVFFLPNGAESLLPLAKNPASSANSSNEK